jgi:mRNA-degrading endonuclease RelE of RelBE toxin-antitoxin system
MKYDLLLSETFKKSVRDLQKRYPYVKNDLREALVVLRNHPETGKRIRGGHGVRKFRIRNSDMRQGKSYGYRLIYILRSNPRPAIHLLFMYAKAQQADISGHEIERLLDALGTELDSQS